MKISLNWILDHIVNPISKIDVGLIVAKFNMRTAEIEHYEKNSIDLSNLFIAKVVAVDPQGVTLWSDELQISISLSYRNDCKVDQLFFVRRNEQIFTWETLAMYSSAQEGLFPAIDCHLSLITGGWRDNCEDSDYILDVDNKSINHRPDLWGHRGIAREIAAFMGWQLKPLSEFLVTTPTVHYPQVAQADKNHSIALQIDDLTICPRIAALLCDSITYKSSQIWMAMRLARIDSKPMNTIVDSTNYVMFDISQPMHVFDANTFADKKLQIRRATNHESLELLDGRQVTLTDQDIVVTDGTMPVALAGVMGGKKSSFSSQSTSIIIESASFHPSMVRNTATRIKAATQASARFAKQLDPMQNTTALLRFVYLAHQAGVITQINESIISVGTIFEQQTIAVQHSFIENRLGLTLTHDQVLALFKALEFIVIWQKNDHDLTYVVTLPTYRTTKDITIPEDLVEEVARLYGFENIAYRRPVRAMQSFDLSSLSATRNIKRYCAFALKMREVRDYLFYDESFLKRLGWYPDNAVAIKNPVSENYKVLVTSLIPHLIKNVELNLHAQQQLNFFEYNNIWSHITPTQAQEQKSLAGIFFGQKERNFYDDKASLQDLFASMQLPISWHKVQGFCQPWFDQLQVADLQLNGVVIGRAGMLSSTFTRPVCKGDGFVFEINMAALLAYKPASKQFTPWSKYQTAYVDMSILIDAAQTAENLSNVISQIDPLIDSIELIDFFEKESWGNKRSLTFRYRICDYQQNLTKEVIDSVSAKVIMTVEKLGAEIR